MFHALLTVIISYNINIHEINKQYHNTYIYRDSMGCHALYSRHLIVYNWRNMRDIAGVIYNKTCPTQYLLPANY